jgi:hypothetical protein
VIGGAAGLHVDVLVDLDVDVVVDGVGDVKLDLHP